MAYSEDDFSIKQLFVPLTTKKGLGIILVVGVVVFFNALFNGFVWDDTAYIVNNVDVHSFSLAKIFGSSYFNKDGYYRAIPALYFTILYGFFAKQALFYHFFQVVLHLINTMLLFRLFTYFFRKEAALILALIFLVHPINVESVAFIGATISPLFVFFGLSALQLLLTKKPLTTPRLMAITLLLFLSLITKEGGVLFFLIALLFTFLYHKKAVAKLFLFACLSITVYLFLRIIIGRVYLSGFEAQLFGQGSTVSDGRFVPIMALSLLQRALMIPSILWYYLKTVFFPIKLAVDQTWIITTYTLQTFYLPLFLTLLFFSLLVFFAWYLKHTKNTQLKAYLFFFTWFIIGLGMHLQLVPLDMTVADRWFYFPFIGLLGMLFLICAHFFSQNKKSTLFTLVCLLLFTLAIRTMIRNANFANEITLYEHDRLVSDNYEIELNLGSAYGLVGKLDKTLYHYQKSVALYPNEANYDSLGLFSEWKGDFINARRSYEKALQSRSFYLNPKKQLAITYIRLSYVDLKLADYEDAREVSLNGLRQYPQEPALWLHLAQSAYKLHHLEEARHAVTKAKALQNDDNTTYTYKTIMAGEELEIK